MRAGIALVCTIILLPAVRAAATPYLIAYEGDVYPEQAGWERHINAGGAVRSLDNGVFTLWGFDDIMISDQYAYNMQEQLNPDPGEYFFAEWRMRLLPESDGSDVGVFMATDGAQRAFDSIYSTIRYRSTRDAREILLDTTVFHTYRLRSFDMVDYSMFIDDELAWQGYFGVGTTLSSVVAFGDRFIGSASGSEWDYFRFGVTDVPAPESLVLILCGLPLVRRRRG